MNFKQIAINILVGVMCIVQFDNLMTAVNQQNSKSIIASAFGILCAIALGILCFRGTIREADREKEEAV